MNDELLVCEGTLMRFDRPLGEVSINEYDSVRFDKVEPDSRYYPYEMREVQNEATVLRFLKERVTPPTRQGLAEELDKHGFDRYSIAAVLLASNGRDCSDAFWIRFADGPQTWDAVWAAIGVHNHLSNVVDR